MRKTTLSLTWLILIVALLAGCSEPADLAPIRQAEYDREENSQVLRDALAGGSVDERLAAAVAMGRIQSPAYAAPLGTAVNDPDAGVRHEVIFALGEFGMVQGVPQEAVAAVKGLLGSEDSGVMAAAVEALGKLAPIEGPELLTPFLTHDAVQVREEAAHALMRWRFTPVWRGDEEEPAPWPDDASAALAAALQDPEPAVRIAAAHAFSRYGDDRALESLAATESDDHALVRLFAVRGVGRSGVPEAADSIAWGLTDSDPGVRAETVQAMGALERHELLTVALADDESFHVRTNLAQALGGAKSAASLQILRRLEEDKSSSVKAATVASVSTRLGEGYRMLLEEHLKDGRWPVRAAAARAGGFAAAVSDDDPRVAAAALEGMEGKLSDPEIAAAVRSALSSDDLAVRGIAAGLLEEWPYPDKVELLQHVLANSPGVRWIELQSRVRDALEELEVDVPQEEDLQRLTELPSRDFESNPVIMLETSKGVMEIECFPTDAPVHVANFVKHVEAGTYDGLIWHRVVPNFVIQGGDPEGNGWGGPGYTIPDEINRKRYGRGAVGMPKLGKDTGGCQLFITHIPTPHLDGNYTIFGQVVAGMDVIDRIEVGDVILKATLN